jgi:intein-encoded DNA endonuclease-like protein
MQPSTNQLSPGFITIDAACALINSDTREKPVVDMDYLVAHIVWIETNHNFRIPKIRRLDPGEIRRTKRGKIIEYENVGDAYVYIATNYEKELLKKTILDKFKELVGRDYKEAGVIARSTVADDAQGRAAVQPRTNNKPIAKEGAIIGSGETVTSNGDGLSV